ncbi:MAG: TMEM143 family protein [Pseudomonadota bacterium]
MAHTTASNGTAAGSERTAAHTEAELRHFAQPEPDVVPPDGVRRETFLPVTRTALIDRLTRPNAWDDHSEARDASRFFRYLAYWRQQQYAAETLRLEQTYEPFNPDTDLLLTRQYTDAERQQMQKRLVGHMEHLLEQANFVRIDPKDVAKILEGQTHYGLDFELDLDAFEELVICYRGASTKKDQKRTLRKFFRKTEFEVPVFQRLFVLFKIKPDDVRVSEIMKERGVTEKKATKIVKKLRSRLPPAVRADNIYMKMFRDIPRADIEMIFPNTRVKFRMLDKVKLGITGAGGIGAGALGAAGKIAVAASNPIPAAMAIAGLGGVAFRQVMSAFNQHQKYMVVMAQNLYFHSLADNRGVLILLADRAAEEDVKEEILLYSVLAKEQVYREDLDAVDRGIEQFLHSTFGINVDFDLDDALGRLLADGIVSEGVDGLMYALPPAAAAQHIDAMWDRFLDDLPDTVDGEGREFVGQPGGADSGPAATADPYLSNAAQ